MKLLTALLLSVTIFHADAQKVKGETDKFTKQQKLKTDHVWLKNKLGEGIGAYIRSVDSTIFIVLNGYGAGVRVIGSDDEAIFLLHDETTITVYSTGVQTYDVNQYQNTYKHQYSISLSDILLLKDKAIKSIRKYSSEGYADIDIPEKNQDELQKLCSSFLLSFNKANH